MIIDQTIEAQKYELIYHNIPPSVLQHYHLFSFFLSLREKWVSSNHLHIMQIQRIIT